MGRARIAYDNLCRREELPATITAGSSASGAPPERILSEDLTEYWQSAYGVGSTWIEIDLHATELIDLVCLPNTSARPGSTWRVVIAIGDTQTPANVTFDSGTVSGNIIDPYGTFIMFLAAAVLGSRIRIYVTDPSVNISDPDHNCLEIPRSWIAKAFLPTRNFNLDYQETSEDLSKKSRSEAGSWSINKGPILRGLNLTFSTMPEADRLEVRRLKRIVGSSMEVLVCQNDASTRLQEEAFVALPVLHPTTGHPQSGVISQWTLEVMEMV